jgi:hypothetical protein
MNGEIYQVEIKIAIPRASKYYEIIKMGHGEAEN